VTPPSGDNGGDNNSGGGGDNNTPDFDTTGQGIITRDCDGLPTESYVLSEPAPEFDLHYSSQGSQAQWMNNLSVEELDFQNLEPGDKPFEIVNDPELAESGSLVERYTLSTGQCNNFYGDCERGYLRSESSFENPAYVGDEYWFGLSMKIEQDTFPMAEFNVPSQGRVSRGDTWITQWLVSRPVEAGSPGDAGNGREYKGSTFVQAPGDDGFVEVFSKPGFREDLISRSRMFGKWTYFVYHVKFGDATDGGEMTAYVNGQCQWNARIHSLSELWETATFKWGIYRGGIIGELSNGSTELPITQTILIDNIREGLTYDDIAF
jgi:hypothetical protein